MNTAITSIWLMMLYIFLAGAVGGLVNALMSENGFLLPKNETVDVNMTVFRPGCLGNILIGGVAAVVSFGLYGPLSSHFIVGTPAAITATAGSIQFGLSLASWVGAILVGIGGARWLSNEVDKKLLKSAAAQAAGGTPSSDTSRRIALASPAQALSIARSMPRDAQ